MMLIVTKNDMVD